VVVKFTSIKKSKERVCVCVVVKFTSIKKWLLCLPRVVFKFTSIKKSE